MTKAQIYFVTDPSRSVDYIRDESGKDDPKDDDSAVDTVENLEDRFRTAGSPE